MKNLRAEELNSNGLEWLRRKRPRARNETSRRERPPSASSEILLIANIVMMIVSSFQVASSAVAPPSPPLFALLQNNNRTSALSAPPASQQLGNRRPGAAANGIFQQTLRIRSGQLPSGPARYQHQHQPQAQHQQVGAAGVAGASSGEFPRESARQPEWGNLARSRIRRLATRREQSPEGDEAEAGATGEEELLPAAEARKPLPAARPGSASSRQQPAGDSAEAGSSSGANATSGLARAGSAYKNVIAQNGNSVLLHCKVEPAPDLVVSWFRGTGELQLLTYDSSTIIPDDRFVVKAGIVRDDWPLQIKNLNKSQDAGLYQCQTNSEPPVSHFYQLNIVEPQVNILGAPDMAVKLGAAINLTCVISQSPDQLQFIFWYRNERMINYDITEQRGKIVMWRGPPGTSAGRAQDVITSNLQIYNARLGDAGNYTCQPSGARPTSILVHVLEGSDKQLIMFQNDFDPAASSSQQTSSAVSVHLIRLSRGRFYALFASLLIFAGWFHLVAQLQTGISLLLLAVIGLFLGKLTERDEPRGACSEDRLAALCIKSKEASFVDLHQDISKKPSACSKSPNESPKRKFPEVEASGETAADPMDPLIERANSALNLLRTIQAGSEAVDQLDSKQRWRRPPPTGQRNESKPATKVMSSPSAGSSDSAGYGSDARSSPVVLLARPNEQSSKSISSNEPEDEEPEMIELVREPTALRLAMEGLIGTKQRPATPGSELDATEEPYYSAPLSARSAGSGTISDNR